ncbi:MAG: hypothetical protein IIB05_01605 [Bacteroidetes bacterium]|nr:hypothetical protein [Bacteroidota bacterium]
MIFNQTSVKFSYPEIYNNNFIVENHKITGKTIAELNVRTMTESNASHISYTAICIVAMVLIIICVQLLSLLNS